MSAKPKTSSSSKPKPERSSKSTSRKKRSSSTKSLALRKKGPNSSYAPIRAMGWRMWSLNKQSFPMYLNGLTSAKDFMSEGKLRFLFKRIKPVHRKGILARLKDVDPGGVVELKEYARRLRKAKKFEKDVALKEAVQEMEVIVAEAEFEEEGITKARFVSADGIKNNIALCLASGYARREVVEMLGVSADIVANVTTADIQRAKRHLPEAIALAADKKVMHDLITGDVSQDTTRADIIAQRRRKTVLDIAEEGRRQRGAAGGGGDHPSDTRADEDDQQSFFDVPSTEVKKPKEEKPDEDS